MHIHFDFNNPTRILFGSGALHELGRQHLPGKRAMLLMSRGKSAKVSGAYDITFHQLQQAGVQIAEFAKVMENPVRKMVMEALPLPKHTSGDFIVALGGGAVLDSAIAISAMATNEGTWMGLYPRWHGKGKTANGAWPPIVTITLTAGTGSEINCWGCHLNPDGNEKIGLAVEASPRSGHCGSAARMQTVPPTYTALPGDF